MIPHHQQAIELAAMVPDRSKNPQLVALASQISGAQRPEIDTRKAFLVQWGEPQDSSGHDGHGARRTTAIWPEWSTTPPWPKLQTLQGTSSTPVAELDDRPPPRAIEMAKAEQHNGQNVDAKTLAQQIITAQQGEIDQMQKMLAGNP